ncbi:hypothetical protein SRB5_52920 [Streptomyces sp. RB5]|uniref:Uncharacterized protein n=1 Tax=Streptomyces smaragdinus TaxID=2585196 RepID=A0A7K0CQT6_9ACTN|nr:hypothetical protein [Streptomyces smaragdinus]
MAGVGDGLGQADAAAELLVEVLGEQGGGPVADRSVPADHRRNPGRHQPCRQRVRHRNPGRGLRTAAVAGPGGQMPRHIRTGRGQAGGHERELRTWRQQRQQLARGRRTPFAEIVLHEQYRGGGCVGLLTPVVQSVAGQVHHRHPAQLRQSPPEVLGVTGILDHQVQTRPPGSPQDGHLLGLEVQLVLPPRRRRHKRHPEPEPAQIRRRTRTPHATRHSERRQLPSHEPLSRRGQQLEWGAQQRPLRRGRPRGRPHLEDQRPLRLVAQPGQLPQLTVQPPVQLTPHREQRLLHGTAAHGVHVLGGHGVEQIHVSALQHPT